ncbi:MAG: TrkH family potassium uptake protein [Planctomycetes bacterium]|nr:TrkH family potassium uptake protein [Planctomycetota bacterium]
MEVDPLAATRRLTQLFVEARPRVRDRLARPFEVLLPLAAALAAASLLARHGARVPDDWTMPFRHLDRLVVGIFALRWLTSALFASSPLDYLGSRKAAGVVLGALALYYAWLRWRWGAWSPRSEAWESGLLDLAELLLVVRELGHRIRQAQERLGLNPALTTALSFVFIILLGAGLLLLPRATHDGISPVDALFTATSATCVTGLTVVSTYEDFTPFGQAVILALIQVGGLGLMTCVAFFALTLGKGMGIRDAVTMKDVLNFEALGGVGRVVRFILLGTLLAEAAGAAALYMALGEDAPGGRLHAAVFHSVSAFCNAGFALWDDSLVRFRGDPAVNLTIAGLLVLGGLGFIVALDLVRAAGVRLRLASAASARPNPGTTRRLLRDAIRMDEAHAGAVSPATPHLGVQARMVLWCSVVLAVLGAVAILLVEYHGPAFAPLGPWERVMASVFQSLTTRTAGFNTVPIAELSRATQFLMMMLMFVGASPGSTGGGIKTVTFVLLLANVVSVFRGRSEVEAFGRRIPHQAVRNAVAVAISGGMLVSVFAFVLCLTEGFSFEAVLFETVSAFATVGLSTGITPELSATGKLLLAVLMLLGRIGPLTLVLALAHREGVQGYEYPAENVMIG